MSAVRQDGPTTISATALTCADNLDWQHCSTARAALAVSDTSPETISILVGLSCRVALNSDDDASG
jgi:hypothetical protein